MYTQQTTTEQLMEKLKHEYNDFKIKNHETGWLEIITPFLDTSNDYIPVYIKDNVISDDGNTLQYITENKIIKTSKYVCQETKYWNEDLMINKENQIICINFTPQRLMVFIQLLLKIQGIIEN